MHHRQLLLGLGCILLIASASFAGPPDELKADEETLKAAGIGTDDAALIDFFRSNTLEDGNREKIAALIVDLGASDFRVREKASNELVKIGRNAALLLRQAKDNGDAEVKRRANSCLEKIEQKQQPALIGAAARLLAARGPATTAQTLLKFAIHSPTIETRFESVRDALAVVAGPRRQAGTSTCRRSVE